MRSGLQAAAMLGLLAACGPLAAAEVVFYRCTDAHGALTVQNMPCPKGMRQTKKVMQAVESSPPPPVALVVAPVTPLLAAPAPEPPVAAAPRPPRAPAATRPLPPLLQCQTAAGESYFSEGEQAPSRCVALRVTGLDGNPQTGAGEACEVVRDRCIAVTDDQACAMWQQRMQEAESHWRFALPGHVNSRQRDYQRLRDLLSGSHCAD